MKRRFTALPYAAALLLIGTRSANATMTMPISLEEHTDAAVAVCVAEVAGLRSYLGADNGGIYTTATLRLIESLKGTFPDRVNLTHRGGAVGLRGEFQSDTPNLKVGEARLFFLGRRANGTLFALHGPASARLISHSAAALNATGYGPLFNQLIGRIKANATGGEDVTDQAASAVSPQGVGGFLDSGGAPSRFLAQDRGEPIPVIIDNATLPMGMTPAQGLTAVTNALNAWAAVSSLQFKIEGFETFGQAADNIDAGDGKLRIQLHDTFNTVSGSSTLGVGGRSFTLSTGSGGQVAGTEFFVSRHGYVVMDHTKASLQDPVTFEEVLTHEIGHALSLAHSSETSNEPNQTLFQAIMFDTAKADGRGAMLGTHDINIIRQAYPENNTPPFGFDRAILGVHFNGTLQNPIVNQASVHAGDLQNDALTFELVQADTIGNGTFTENNGVVSFAPAGDFGPGVDIDHTGTTFRAGFHSFRAFDGVHRSPVFTVSVKRLLRDSQPPGNPDGLPDTWMTAHFGSIVPVTGTSEPGDDPDNDNYTNLDELLANTDPNDPSSHPRILSFSPDQIQWSGQNFDYYELQSTTDFTTWNTIRRVVMDGNPGTLKSFSNTADTMQFFRMQRLQ